MMLKLIGLCQPLDGVTNPKYKLKCFITTNIFFFEEKKALAFNRDRCRHLAFCYSWSPSIEFCVFSPGVNFIKLFSFVTDDEA